MVAGEQRSTPHNGEAVGQTRRPMHTDETARPAARTALIPHVLRSIAGWRSMPRVVRDAAPVDHPFQSTGARIHKRLRGGGRHVGGRR